MTYLVPGSSLLHGSQTSVGGVADYRMNDLWSYVAHQASVSALEPLNDSLIHELSFTPRHFYNYYIKIIHVVLISKINK